MARPKKEEEIIIETPVEETAVDNKTNSDAKIKFQNFIDAYAKANPAKYELKKEALLAKLNTL